MILRREQNEIKRRFSIDGRKFGFSLFSTLKRFFPSYKMWLWIFHIIWTIFLGMKNETSDCEIDCKKKQLVSPKISNEEFPGKISRDLQFLNDQELLKMFPEYILKICLWAVLGSRLSFPNKILPRYNRNITEISYVCLCLSEWYSEAFIHLFKKGCYTLAWRMSAIAFWLPVL